MAFCTYADVLAHTGTDLIQATVEALIADSDRRIKGMLKSKGLTAPTSDDTLTSASIALTKAKVLMRKRLDGSRPNSISVGGVSRSDSNDTIVRALEDEGLELVTSYIKEQLEASGAASEAAERSDSDMSELRLDQYVPYVYWED